MSNPMNNDELKETFDHFDADKNGHIDFAEFNQLLDALDCGIEDMARRLGFDVIDTDSNGTIEFDEFCSWWTEQNAED